MDYDMKKLLVFILYDSLFKALCYTDSEPKVLDSIITQNEYYTPKTERERCSTKIINTG